MYFMFYIIEKQEIYNEKKINYSIYLVKYFYGHIRSLFKISFK